MLEEKIAIVKSNERLIKDMIDHVNGCRPGKYTINSFFEIEELVKSTEKTLCNIKLAPTNWKGTQIVITSGEAVAKSYKSSRKANCVIIERGSKEWFIKSFEVVAINVEGGDIQLRLSQQNKDKVFLAFKKIHNIV